MEFTFIEEMIRQKAKTSRTWMLVVSIAAFVIMGALFFFKYLEVMPVENVDDFIKERSSRHPYVRLENAFLLNTYYTLEETEDSRKSYYSYFLFIDPNEEEYRMFLVQLSGRGYLNQDYLEDITIEGELKRLTSTDREVIADLINDYDFFEDEDFIVTGLFREKEDPEVVGWIMFVLIGLAGIIFLIAAIPGMITNKNPSKVAALRKARVQYDSIIYNMENAARSGREIYSDPHLLIAEGGIFGAGKNGGWMFTPMQGLLLVSMTRTTHYTYFIKTGTSLVLKLYFDDKKVKILKPGQYDTEEIYAALITNCPNVLVDSDNKLQRLFKRNFEEFRAAVAERLRVQNEEIKQLQELEQTNNTETDSCTDIENNIKPSPEPTMETYKTPDAETTTDNDTDTDE